MAKPKPLTPAKEHSESDAWHQKTQELWDTGQYRLAFRRLLAAAKREDCTAQLNLGYFYDLGLGVSRRKSLALHWYKRAYRQGHGSGANNIGTVYRDWGEFQTALMWFERAVEFGDLSAHWNIARMYFRQRSNIAKTILHFQRIVEAKRGVEVSGWEFDTATRYLRWLERRKNVA